MRFRAQANYATEIYFRFSQDTGNPTGGTVVQIDAVDVDATSLLRLDHTGDADSILVIDSGSTAAQVSGIRLEDRGTLEWRIDKSTGNNLGLVEAVANITRIDLVKGFQSDDRTGAPTGDHIFRDSVGAVRARIRGDGGVCVGADETTCVNQAAAGVLELLGDLESDAANPADEGFIRTGNTEDIFCAELATPGTDLCVQLNANDRWQFDGDLSWLSGTAFQGIFAHANTANRTYTLPDATTSLAHAPAALTSGQLVQGNGGAEVQASGFTVQAAGSAGTNVTNAGTATSLARSDHEHRVPWQVGAHYEATPAVAESTVPLPVNEACGGSIDATVVHITALTKGSGSMSFNVVRYNSAGTSQGNLFASNQSYSNTGNNRQSFTPDQNNTNIGATDYFRVNFVTVNGQDDLTVAVSGKCKNVN